MVAAGSVVTSDVPANAIVMGNPARITGYVDAVAGVPPADRKDGTSEAMGHRGVRMIDVAVHADLRGSLVATEFTTLPFVPARTFAVFAVPSKEVRGAHAHRTCEQLLTCVAGSVKVAWDDGECRGEVTLDTPNTSLYVPAWVWCMQYQFSEDSVLLVHASLPYDPSDYIRTYDEFMRGCGAS